MARRYDSRTTIFSPEGRLYQVEYAMEAISNAGAAIGVLAKDGVVLVAEKRITSKVRAAVAASCTRCRAPMLPGAGAAARPSKGLAIDALVRSPAAAGHQGRGRAEREDVQARRARSVLRGGHHRCAVRRGGGPALQAGCSARTLHLTPTPVAADANILVNIARLSAQRYYFAYQEPMPVEQLVRSISDTKQVRSGTQRAARAALLPCAHVGPGAGRAASCAAR